MFGVWASKDIVFVTTERLTFFLQKEEKKCNMILEEKVNGIISKSFKAKMTFNESNNLIINLINDSTESILKSISTSNNKKYFDHLEMELVQQIFITNYNEYPNANESNIGYCLSNWHKYGQFQLGSTIYFNISLKNLQLKFILKKGAFLYVDINLQNSNNNGKVWKQIVRLKHDSLNDESKVILPDSFVKSLKEKILIEDKLFIKNKCSYLENMLRYWSLNSFSEKEIILNGCNEKYRYKKIERYYGIERDMEFYQ